MRLLPGASDDGVLAPFGAAGVSAGVSTAESAICGAGEASGVDAGLDAGDGCAAGSWGNCASVLGESLSTAVNVLVGLVDIFADRLAGDVVPRWRWRWVQAVVMEMRVDGGRGFVGVATLVVSVF